MAFDASEAALALDRFSQLLVDDAHERSLFQEAIDSAATPVYFVALVQSLSKALRLMVFGYNRIPVVSWLRQQALESMGPRPAAELVTALGDHPSPGQRLMSHHRSSIPTTAR